MVGKEGGRGEESRGGDGKEGDRDRQSGDARDFLVGATHSNQSTSFAFSPHQALV